MSEKEQIKEQQMDPRFLQVLLDTIPSPIFYKDMDGLYLGCNKAFEGYLGLTRDQIVGKSVYEVAPQELADTYYKMDLALFSNPGVQKYEAAVRFADGSIRDVIFNKATFSDGRGDLAGLVGVMLDITERKKTEEAIRQSEILTRSSLDSLSAHIVIIDTDGLILAVNNAWRAFATANGLLDYEFLGSNYLTICDQGTDRYADEAPVAAAGIRAVISGRMTEFALEYPCHSPTEKRWFNMRVTRSLSPTPTRLAIAHEDITVRKLAEDALRKARDELETRVGERTLELAKANEELQIEIAEHRKDERKIIQQNEFLNHVVESLTHPFYVLDANDYTIVMANSAASGGVLPAGTTCYALTHRRSFPCSGSEHLCPLQIIKQTKKPITVEHAHYDRQGNLKNVEVHAYPIFDREGSVAQIIEYSLDITERKRMEEELRNTAEKIKIFAYAVSHDLKSPLIGINGLARLLYKQYRDLLDEKGKKYVEQILKASEQVLSLVQEINLYVKTKETPLEFERIKIKEILQMVRDEFEALLSSRQVNWLEPDQIPDVRADRMCFVRVFRNLVDNALKYGGEELSEIVIEHVESEEFHTFSVSDDGVGIEEEDCDQIFELFQRQGTSRGVEGTGLGLAIVKEIIEKHRGKVWVEQGPRKGATFYFSISKIL